MQNIMGPGGLANGAGSSSLTRRAGIKARFSGPSVLVRTDMTAKLPLERLELVQVGRCRCQGVLGLRRSRGPQCTGRARSAWVWTGLNLAPPREPPARRRRFRA